MQMERGAMIIECVFFFCYFWHHTSSQSKKVWRGVHCKFRSVESEAIGENYCHLPQNFPRQCGIWGKFFCFHMFHRARRANFCFSPEFSPTAPENSSHAMRWEELTTDRWCLRLSVHEDLVPVRWNDVRWSQLSSHRGVWQKSELN